MLTWWGVSVAILSHNPAGGVLLGQATMTKVVPIFVAVMVWLIRVLIIGTFSVAGENLFSLADERPRSHRGLGRPAVQSVRGPAATFVRPAPKPIAAAPKNRPSRVEPSYHPIGMNAQSTDEGQGMRRS